MYKSWMLAVEWTSMILDIYIPKEEPLTFSDKLHSKCKRKRGVIMVPSILV